jgi:BolA protein
MTERQPVTAADVRAALEAAFAGAAIDVADDSDQHIGHAGAREGRHFSVRVSSAAFEGLSRVARHRLVYHALHRLVGKGIHALAIDARTPDEP